MASLLERFYDVKHGSITIDNVNIQHLDPSWLRGHAIGFINQVIMYTYISEVQLPHKLTLRMALG